MQRTNGIFYSEEAKFQPSTTEEINNLDREETFAIQMSFITCEKP